MKYAYESNEQWARRVVREHDEAKAAKAKDRAEAAMLAVATLCIAAAVVFAYAAGVTWESFQ